MTNRVKIEIVGSISVEVESDKEHINDVELRARMIVRDLRKGGI